MLECAAAVMQEQRQCWSVQQRLACSLGSLVSGLLHRSMVLAWAEGQGGEGEDAGWGHCTSIGRVAAWQPGLCIPTWAAGETRAGGSQHVVRS